MPSPEIKGWILYCYTHTIETAEHDQMNQRTIDSINLSEFLCQNKQMLSDRVQCSNEIIATPPFKFNTLSILHLVRLWLKETLLIQFLLSRVGSSLAIDHLTFQIRWKFYVACFFIQTYYQITVACKFICNCSNCKDQQRPVKDGIEFPSCGSLQDKVATWKSNGTSLNNLVIIVVLVIVDYSHLGMIHVLTSYFLTMNVDG